jgi:hypothetical protein
MIMMDGGASGAPSGASAGGFLAIGHELMTLVAELVCSSDPHFV